MKFRDWNICSFVVVATAFFSLNLQQINARPSTLDDLGDMLAQQISDAKIHKLAVAEFVTPEGEASPRGKYLAALLCEGWSQHHAKFTVVEPASFRQTLAERKLTIQDLKSPESLEQIGATLGVEAVVLGTLTDTADGYLVTVTVKTTSDGVLLLTKEQPLAHSHVLDNLAATNADTSVSAQKAGVNGVGVPACTYAPTPVFPAGARKAKISASAVVVLAVVSTEGLVTNIRVLKDPGYGFAARAVEKLTEWRCKPALDKDKKPVVVTVPIEISFHDWQK
jgi:TonB family protein